MGEWLNRGTTTPWNVTIQNNELSIQATTWMNLEEIMLNEKAVSKAYILHDLIYGTFVKDTILEMQNI